MSARRRILNEEVMGESAEGTKVLRTELFYAMGGPILELIAVTGGTNLATYKREPRGYYVSVQPLTKRTETLGDRTYTTESLMMFSGIKDFVEAARSFSAKRLAEISVDPDQIAKLRAHVLAQEGESR